MDLITTLTPTRSLDSEYDTPRIQPIHSLSFTNGPHKKHHHHHHSHHQPPPTVVVKYKECLKNHAASIGGHALDGCGEFIASSTANPTDPTSLKCAACGCHRNFHRREPTTTTTTTQVQVPSPGGGYSSSPTPPTPPPPPPPPQQQQPFSAPHMLLSLSTAVHGDQPPMNHHHHQQHHYMATATAIGRKRTRTKFTQEQKEKMHGFAEKINWKMQKTDGAMIEEFCNEIGVARSVLKVWMHNNKYSFAKKNNGGNENGGINSFDDINGIDINSSSNNDDENNN